MIHEEILARMIGVTREDLRPYREGRVEEDADRGNPVMWDPDMVPDLLVELGIGREQIPAGWFEALEAAGQPQDRVEEVLTVYRTTQNPALILCKREGVVVRCRIRANTSEQYRPSMKITAVLEKGDLWRVHLGKTRFQK